MRKIKTQKQKTSLQSTNFWFSIVAMFVLTMTVFGINIDPDKLDSVISAVQSKQLLSIVTAVLAAVMMLYNVFKNQHLTGKIKDLFKNQNWWVALVVLVADLTAVWQFGFPEKEANALIETIFSGGSLTSILTGVFLFGNSLYFIFLKKKKA